MKVLLDTSAMIALVLQRDQFHAAARSFLRTKSLQLATNSFLLAEFYTHIQRRYGFDDAMRAYEQILNNAVVEVVDWHKSHDMSTYGTLRRLRGLSLSYADASLITLGVELGISEVFSFDDDFRQAGLRVLPD